MILGDKLFISEVVLSQTCWYGPYMKFFPYLSFL
jgi:hypothetical protein